MKIRDIILLGIFAFMFCLIFVLYINQTELERKYTNVQKELEIIEIEHNVIKNILNDSIIININITENGKRIN